VIKGTEVYNPEKGGVVDLSILDVQQIFGRAGRPQFDTSGEATMITSIDAFPRYMDKLVRAVPIESNFIKHLADHLNAEVVGGTVTNIQEAVTWLTYTYLYTRMRRNPIGYGIKEDEKNSDPMLKGRCNELVREAAKLLDLNRMIRYDQQSGNLSVADRGRVAAHFYIQSESIATFNEMLAMTDYYTDADLCRVICNATEFRNLKIRQEEMSELEELVKTACPLPLKGAGMDDRGRGLITDASDKAFVLLQAYISRAKIKSFTLITDMNYIASNASRVARAVFEICLKQNSAGPALKLLRIAKSADTRIWWFQTPMRIFEDEFSESVYSSIETKSGGKGYDSLYSALSLLDMQPKEVEIYCRWNKSNKGGRGGEKIQRFVRTLPNLHIECDVQPVTSSVMRFHILVTPNFEWNGRWHGGAQSFWLWVEDGENNRIYHDESILFAKRTFPDAITLDLSIPAFEPMPSQYFIRAISDSWVGSEMLLPVSLDHVQMVKDKTPITPVYDLSPVPVTSLAECKYEQLYRNFKCFNSIQSQLFHVLYHTDSPVLLGAPTGSGKTIVAELALLRMKRIFPKGICVYIAPLKSLARERLKEWKIRLGSAPLRWKILELSGDTHHDQGVVESADVLVCTPEKWDLISRGWRSYVKAEASENAGKAFVKRVKLLVLDEVHLLGEERGAVLEAIVSRTRFISQFVEEQNNAKTSKPKEDVTRIIGLSTALANPLDLADWIGIDTRNTGPTRMRGLYNFSSSVRPVPLTVHVQGYPGRHYCPRMATMNKPCFAAIKEYSPAKPVLIFVASRRQTRLTAFDIISYAAAEANPKRFLKCNEEVVDAIINTVSDEALRHTLAFGIGLHHAGISSHDRDVVETMYLSGKIQVLVATSTLAWGVNTPAHLVIVKGTEYFDGKSSRYVDYPLTDVLQMIGRAGRPGFDDRGSAVVMSTEDKKPFYKKVGHNRCMSLVISSIDLTRCFTRLLAVSLLAIPR
jgi:activating signal cointegrator complex subunit 3